MFDILGPVILPILAGQFRHILTFGGGALVVNGYTASSESQLLAGIAIAAAGVLYSAIQKCLAQRQAKKSVIVAAINGTAPPTITKYDVASLTPHLVSTNNATGTITSPGPVQ